MFSKYTNTDNNILNITTMDECKKMSAGQLVFVGLGLYDEQDVSLKGMMELKACDQVYAEFYTAKPGRFHQHEFEKLIGKKIEVLSRQDTEDGKKILQEATDKHVVFLTCGDPMIATTHVDLRLRAIKQGIRTRIIHSSSIATAAPGLLGLQNYKFGRTTTLAFPEKEYFPTSPYTVILENKKMGLHTLVLLDIQAEKNRYMTANEGLALLLKMEGQLHQNLFTEDSIACVVARAGSSDPLLAADSIKVLLKKEFGPPLHTLVIPGDLHFMEREALEICAGLPSEVNY
jgi:diphthine synthase